MFYICRYAFLLCGTGVMYVSFLVYHARLKGMVFRLISVHYDQSDLMATRNKQRFTSRREIIELIGSFL